MDPLWSMGLLALIVGIIGLFVLYKGRRKKN